MEYIQHDFMDQGTFHMHPHTCECGMHKISMESGCRTCSSNQFLIILDSNFIKIPHLQPLKTLSKQIPRTKNEEILVNCSYTL